MRRRGSTERRTARGVGAIAPLMRDVRRCLECVAWIAARLCHVIANGQGQAPAEDGSRPQGSAASERLYRRSNTWETMRLVHLLPWRASHGRNRAANKAHDNDSRSPRPWVSMETGAGGAPVSCSIMCGIVQ